MRVVVVSMVKNESDIIETFCRHVAAFADHHLIFDHQSTDGTPILLDRLIREGLPITAFTDDQVGYHQAARTTELMRRAVRDFAADWVIPLDADEFPQSGAADQFRNQLADWLPAGRPVWFWLHDYAPHPSDDPTEPNPVLRLRHRADDLYRCTGKVAVPRILAADPEVRLGPGNHDVLRGGTPIAVDRTDAAWLAHFPIRTAGQGIVKIVQGELQRLAGGSRGGGGNHYEKHFQRIVASPRSYMTDPASYLRGEQSEPTRYWGEVVRYPVPLGEWERVASSLLPFVERLAASHGAMVDATARREASLFRRLQKRVRRWLSLDSPSEDEMVNLREGLVLPDSRSINALGAELEVIAAESDGQQVRVTVRVQNTGMAVWRHQTPDGVGQVLLGVQLWESSGGRLEADYHRHLLPADLAPGEQMELEFSCPSPEQSGVILRLDMVSELVRWFDSPWCAVDPAALPRPVS